MPSVADLLGVESTILFEGKSYKLREPNQLEQAQFTRWLESRAREAAGRATDVPPEVQDRMLTAVMRDIAACVYEWEGEASAAALTTPLGMAKVLHIVIGGSDPEFSLDDAKRMVRTAIKEVAAVLVKERVGDADPKVTRAVLDVLGLPSDSSSPPSSTPPSASAPTGSPG